MPYNRPGNSVYVTNSSGGTYVHGQPVSEAVGASREVGIAVKQRPTHWTDGLAVQNQIANGESYLILRDGIAQVADGGVGFADGDLAYITNANALTKTSGGNQKFGKVVEIPSDGRGVPVGQVRINMNERNSF